MLDYPLRVLVALWILRRIELRDKKIKIAYDPANEMRLAATAVANLVSVSSEKGGLVKDICRRIVVTYAERLMTEAQKFRELHVVATGEFKETKDE